MKKLFATILLISSFACGAMAQNTDTTAFTKMKMQHHFNHKNHKGKFDQLNLSEDQKKQLQTINEDYHNQMKELNKNENITVKEFRDKKYELKKEHKKKFESILTAEQKTKLQQLKLQREQQKQMQAAKKLDKMKTRLGLSDEQVAQIKSQQQELHSKLKAIKENDNLSRTEKQQQLQALKEESKDDFKKILTPDQLSKMQEWKKNKEQKKYTD